MTLREIAAFIDGEVLGDENISITGVAKIEEAKSGDITFLANPQYERFLETTAASAVIVNRSADLSKHVNHPALVRVGDAYASFVIVLEKLNPPSDSVPPGVHPTALIPASTTVGKNCAIGPYVVFGEGCSIGSNTKIFPGTVVGNSVRIGSDCLIYGNVTIRESCILGNRVVIQSGAVIGADGFGFAPKKNGSYMKIPQLGIVVLEDDVEVQANACIDRATIGETRIRRGTKIDNLVQIAHNAVVGEDTVIAGGTMVAGSTKIGNKNMIGGNASITGHIFTSDDVKIGGHSGVSRQLDTQGETYMGYPAKEARKWRRQEGAIRQLPELLVEFRALQKKISELEEEIKRLKK
ncbi:MAG: UDP-3-O-(3-hydroxymyristoyl)glucosamine N-acyltransferase [Bacteroidota bacterium]|nr:UDP-3-O-(3-hydroxymyristoyl)glucosamine N-acyltransferase [Bacteroidota bacterium]